MLSFIVKLYLVILKETNNLRDSSPHSVTYKCICDNSQPLKILCMYFNCKFSNIYCLLYTLIGLFAQVLLKSSFASVSTIQQLFNCLYILYSHVYQSFQALLWTSSFQISSRSCFIVFLKIYLISVKCQRISLACRVIS